MAKLLSKDCYNIIMEAFSHPDIDHVDFYENKINEYYDQDSEVIQKLISILDILLQNYLEEAASFSPRSDPDRYTIQLPLSLSGGFIRKIDLKFLEHQKKILETFQKIKNTEYAQEALEKFRETLRSRISNVNPTPQICKRIVAAFCVSIHFLNKKFELSSDWTKDDFSVYIEKNFKDIAGVQATVKTLAGWTQKSGKKIDERELSLFNYDRGKRTYVFMEKNYNEMIKSFPDEYNEAVRMN